MKPSVWKFNEKNARWIGGQTLINPFSVPQKMISFAASRLVTLLPVDNLPTFCCCPLNQIYHKFPGSRSINLTK